MQKDSAENIKETSEDLLFHYKRGSFRNHESQEVKDLATGKVQISPGLFKSLVATKGNRFMFIALVFTFAISAVIWIFNSSSDTNTVDKFSAFVSAFSFEDKVLAKLELKPVKNITFDEDQNVKVHFDAVNEEGALQNSADVDFTYLCNGEKSQFVTFSFTDYDINKILCRVEYDKKTVSLECKVLRGKQ